MVFWHRLIWLRFLELKKAVHRNNKFDSSGSDRYVLFPPPSCLLLEENLIKYFPPGSPREQRVRDLQACEEGAPPPRPRG